MRNRLHLTTLLGAALTLGAVGSSLAQGTNYGTQVTQAANAYYGQAIWKPIVGGVPTGTAVGLTNGNVYTALANGTNSIGTNALNAVLNNTRIRTQPVNGVQTFPSGSVLVLNTNTELRLKSAGTGAANVVAPTFVGSNGSPGLIVNGGMLNDGDATTTYILDGLIQIASQSYISHGNNGGSGGATTDRALLFKGVLSGTGNMVIMNASATVPQIVSNVNNTFSGKWIVQCGYLRGAVQNSLGTNSIIVDPGYMGFTNDMPFANSTNSGGGAAAVFEPNYDLNSAGALILTNNGAMRLHQACFFTSVIIEGVALSPGVHPFSELFGNYANFSSSTSGSITVRPYQTIIAATVNTQPVAQRVFPGGNTRFTATGGGTPPLTYVWQKNGTNLTDGGNVIGSTNTALFVSNVSAADAGNYALVVSNSGGSITSSVVPLVIVVTNGEAYESAVIATHPYAFYQLNEGGDNSTNPPAFDNANGYNAIYGTGAQDALYGIFGPQPPTWPGFVSTNGAAGFFNGTATAHLTLATPWALNTNTVTIAAWVNPSSAQNANTGLVICRGGDTVAGLNFAGVLDANGQATLGYVWNNDPATYNWSSGIEVPAGQWSFVAVSVTASNATVSMMNASGLVSATHVYPHPIQSFNATTLIGDDSAGANGNRVFNGNMDDVTIYNRALSKTDLTGLFYTSSGISAYGPIIVTSPANQTLYAGQTATFNVVAGGSDPVTYQWLKDSGGNNVFAPISEGGRFSGTATATLTISNINSGDANNYEVIVSNPSGSPVTSNPASLTVNPTSGAQAITSVAFQPAGADWNTVSVTVNGFSEGTWSTGLGAADSAAQFLGSSFELLPGSSNTAVGVLVGGALLRSPTGPKTAVFPGASLKISGNGVWVNGPTTNTTTTAELRFKQPTFPNGEQGAAFFPLLILNGGQIDNGADSGGGVNSIIIQGHMDVATNSTLYNDATSDRGYDVNSFLTGAGTLEYHGYNTTFQSAFTNALVISGTSNTFSGKWNVVVGTLIGAGSNSLGTNEIQISGNSALETLYDINNPGGILFLSGRMYLHQNDTFKSLFVNGIPLAVGTYTWAQLNAAYPTNFPANWGVHYGAAAVTNGSGSITVLVQPAPQITTQPTPATLTAYPAQTVQITAAAQGSLPLFLFWQFSNGGAYSNLTEGAHFVGTTTNTLTISNIVPGDAGNYRIVASNSVGSVTSLVATLTVMPTGPATNLTLNFGGVPIVEAVGQDWNLTNAWSDGQPASVSIFSNPGSTYEVVIGARLRNTDASSSSFPGSVLIIDGPGTPQDGNTTAAANTGEIRTKHTADPSTIFFPKLVLNGGQLDAGDNGTIIIQGEVNIAADSIIEVNSGASGTSRFYQMDAKLTGSGGLTYIQFIGTSTPYTGGINLTSPNNTFTGTWNVSSQGAAGVLLGSGANSLGTNNITVGIGGAVETLYNINNPNGDLNLTGQMYLHQNDTFATVEVSGTNLAVGTYTFAQLNTAYPTNFPASWTQQPGSTFNAGSGSIKVVGSGSTPPPVSLGGMFSPTSGLTLTWTQGTLQQATNALGPWSPVPGANPPSYTVVSPTDASHFYRIKVQ